MADPHRQSGPMLRPPAGGAAEPHESRPTNAWRIIHGAASGHPGWYVDRLGDYLLSQADIPATDHQRNQLQRWCGQLALKGLYHKQLDRQLLKKSSPGQACPALLFGQAAPPRFEVVENGVRFWLSFAEGYSTGLFIDQRDNRHRLLTGQIAGQFKLAARPVGPRSGPGPTSPASPAAPLAGLAVLNTFAYTCSFSVCAALAGAVVTSLDLSRKYLDWGRDNFRLNGLDPDRHDFIYGDCFNWMKRLAKKGRQFDLVVLDPPTFSHSKQSGVFRAETDYGNLVALALTLLPGQPARGGVLLACTNAVRLKPGNWLDQVRRAVAQSGRRIDAEHLAPQPPDFPTSRDEPAYLKVAWLRII